MFCCIQGQSVDVVHKALVQVFRSWFGPVPIIIWCQYCRIFRTVYGGAPAARRAAKRSPILIWETKGNLFSWLSWLAVIARGRVRTTTTTTESCNMAAILQMLVWQRHVALVYRLLLWYCTSMLLSIDTCETKVSADQYHVTISRAQVYSSSRSRVFFEVDRWPSAVFY